MTQVSKRNRQVADLIHREVALLLKHSVNDPRLSSVLVTMVDLSPDLKNARVLYTLPEDADHKEVEAALKKATGFIRRCLSEQVELRYTPNIRFKYDNSIERARHILSLMDKFESKSDE